MYRLIDLDASPEPECIGIGDTAAEALARLRLDHSLSSLGAFETWQELVDAAADHTDGLRGIVTGYALERVAASTSDVLTVALDRTRKDIDLDLVTAAISMIKGVISVTAEEVDAGAWCERSRAKLEMQERLWTALRETP